MTRLTMLFIAVALVLPGAALAQPVANLRAPDRDQGTRAALAQPVANLRAPDRDQGTRAALAATLHRHGVDQAAAQRKAAASDAITRPSAPSSRSPPPPRLRLPPRPTATASR